LSDEECMRQINLKSRTNKLYFSVDGYRFYVSFMFLLSADDEPIDLVLHVSSACKKQDYQRPSAGVMLRTITTF
jgi:hypothetical protein